MKSAFLFRGPLLPEGFQFPPQYEELARQGAWPDIEPWSFLATSIGLSLSHYGSMLVKYPDRPLLPFARLHDPTGMNNDGYVVLASFDGSDKSGQPRVRIYDFAAPKKSPWDNVSYVSFDAWLEAAKKESTEFKALKDDDD